VEFDNDAVADGLIVTGIETVEDPTFGTETVEDPPFGFGFDLNPSNQLCKSN
jgi:hypothetical protein